MGVCRYIRSERKGMMTLQRDVFLRTADIVEGAGDDSSALPSIENHAGRK